jgi:hypothetical protein
MYFEKRNNNTGVVSSCKFRSRKIGSCLAMFLHWKAILIENIDDIRTKTQVAVN